MCRRVGEGDVTDSVKMCDGDWFKSLRWLTGDHLDRLPSPRAFHSSTLFTPPGSLPTTLFPKHSKQRLPDGPLCLDHDRPAHPGTALVREAAGKPLRPTLHPIGC
jgi:hypothetical protein